MTVSSTTVNFNQGQSLIPAEHTSAFVSITISRASYLLAWFSSTPASSPESLIPFSLYMKCWCIQLWIMECASVLWNRKLKIHFEISYSIQTHP